jgi:Zn-dependent peptidase ImmA (M78 family)
MRNSSIIPVLKVREILANLDIRCPSEIKVKDIAWTRKLLVREEALDSADGRLVCRSNKGVITVNASIPEIGWKRFAISHEIGHFELHRNPDGISLYTDRYFSLHDRRHNIETEANEFAAELLMPENLFKPMCKSGLPNFDTVSALADKFQTSLTATALRYVDYSSYTCVLVASQDKVIKWFRASEDFTYFIEIGSKVSPYAVAMDLFQNPGMNSNRDDIPASAWIKNSYIDPNAMIKEHAVALRHYNQVLSLIWNDGDIRS